MDLISQRDLAIKFCDDNLNQCCIELLEYKRTGLLQDGKVRELRNMLDFAGHSAMALGEEFIKIVTSVLSKAANGMDLDVAVDECMREERQDVRIKANEELRKLRQDNAQLQYALEQSESAYLKLAGSARCEYCDGTGSVHSQVGEFLGLCRCGVPLNLERKEL